MQKCNREYWALKPLSGNDVICCPYHEHEYNQKERECNRIYTHDGKYFNVA
jgi:hypothetical protein